MDAGVLIPLAAFAGVVVIVGLINFSALRDREVAMLQFLQGQEAEHKFRMTELESQLQRVRQGE